jgi:hypothetical protein
MAAGLFKAPTKNYWSTSLDGAIASDVTTITLTSVTNLQAPGYIVINREDNSGTATPNSREVIKFTGISGNDLTTCSRGADNSTARAHADGSLVEAAYTIGMHNDQRDAINAEHDTDGTHTIISAATITTAHIPSIAGSNASVTNVYADNVSGVGGQFYWARTGSLATVRRAVASDIHFPIQRATKNLTINSCYISLISAPSLAKFEADISYGSSPTGDFATIFTTKPTIDVGEFDTSTAATAAVLALTSLASGALLTFEINDTGDTTGGMGASLQVTSR